MEQLLLDEKISEYGIIDFEKLEIITPHLLPKNAEIKSALVILIPYRRDDIIIKDKLNAGLFARCKDYHVFFNGIAEKLKPKFESYSGGKVFAFADHSPIHEKNAAVKCGLGIKGKNGLLINKKYGSYVFIGVFLFEKKLEERIHTCTIKCNGCNACLNACPTKALCADGYEVSKCLSAISQKKTKNANELIALKGNKTVWGCDICQQACPLNTNVESSPIEYFSDDVITDFYTCKLKDMDDATYRKYAFSYRKRDVITQNFLTATEGYDIIS